MAQTARREKLFTRGVSAAIAVMVASCQRSFGSRGGAGAASVTGEALLAPGVAIDVIAAKLPEARLVAGGELQAA